MDNVIKMPRQLSSDALVRAQQAPVRGFSNRFKPEQAAALEAGGLLEELGTVYYQHLSKFVLMDAVKIEGDLQLWVVGRDIHDGGLWDSMLTLSPDDQRELTQTQLGALWASASERHAFMADATNMLELNGFVNPLAEMAYEHIPHAEAA
jgi:hypothetical protein